MKLYRTETRFFVEDNGNYYLGPGVPWDNFVLHEDLTEFITSFVREAHPVSKERAAELQQQIMAPIVGQEVWAAGVTYFRSRDARMEESKSAGGGDFYRRVYDAARPELFYKASGHRVVGHGGKVAIRPDARWSIPEPELALLISPSRRVLGYTIGNDMSSRDIEGENPLYLPQAKVYDRSCALGPGILIHQGPLPSSTAISMNILRDGKTAFSGSTALSAMKRPLQELVEYLYRANSFPRGCFLLTGTGIIPPDDFSLQAGDEIHIEISEIGTLVNTVG